MKRVSQWEEAAGGEKVREEECDAELYGCDRRESG